MCLASASVTHSICFRPVRTVSSDLYGSSLSADSLDLLRIFQVFVWALRLVIKGEDARLRVPRHPGGLS